jgi:hypothetical protein
MKKVILLILSSIPIILYSQSVNVNMISCENFDKQIYNDPLIDYSKYKSFTLISTNEFVKKESQSVLEKQLEFFLSNFISSFCGLEFIAVSDSIKPDLLIVYEYSNDYTEKYIAPRSYSIPYWKSGTSSKTTINSSGSGNVILSGDVNLMGQGVATSKSTINTTSTGEWNLIQVERPGYTVGKFFPCFSFIIYDTKDENKIWEANGTGTSDSKDFRLPGQYIMVALSQEIPRGSFEDPEFTNDNDGQVGIAFTSFNSDGQNFYPIITFITKNTPASKVGLKNLDIILAINGTSTKNKTHKQISLLFKGNVGTKINLTIERNGKIINKLITKSLRQIENA